MHHRSQRLRKVNPAESAGPPDTLQGQHQDRGNRDLTNTAQNLANRVALLTQISSVYFPYTVYETVALGRYCHIDSVLPRLTAVDKEIIEDSLEKVGLQDLRDTKINQLSGGQLQRVFLAKTFAQDPKIILLDEPTNHLDLKYQIELLEYVSQWIKHKERAAVTVLHDLNLVQACADRVILLHQGKATPLADLRKSC